jgi:hypothetical protein
MNCLGLTVEDLYLPTEADLNAFTRDDWLRKVYRDRMTASISERVRKLKRKLRNSIAQRLHRLPSRRLLPGENSSA